MDILVYALLIWLAMSFLTNFVHHYKEVEEEEYEDDKPGKMVFLQIDVEHHNGLWYGWYVSDSQEAFVAQGTTYDEAVLNCKKTLERKNPEFKIVFRFEKKQDEQPALQS